MAAEDLEVPRKSAGQLDEQGTSPVVGDTASARNKWTPGPWHTLPVVGDLISGMTAGSILFGADLPLGSIAVRHGVGQAEVAQANARLIAAAPDLYEALEALVETAVAEVNEKGGAGGSHLARLTDARAALSKARGEA